MFFHNVELLKFELMSDKILHLCPTIVLSKPKPKPLDNPFFPYNICSIKYFEIINVFLRVNAFHFATSLHNKFYLNFYFLNL